MRPTLDVFTAATGALGATALNWNHTCTGNNLFLIVYLFTNASVTNLSMTYNGVAMTQLSINTGKTHIAVLANPATGTHQVACSWTTARPCTGASISYINVNSPSNIGEPRCTIVANSASSPTSENIATHSDNTLVSLASGYNTGSGTVPTVTQGATLTSRGTATYVNGTTNTARIRISDLPGDGAKTASYTFANFVSADQVDIVLPGVNLMSHAGY